MSYHKATILLASAAALACAPAPVKPAMPEPLPSLGMPISQALSLHLGDVLPAHPDFTFHVFRSATDSFPVRGYILRGLFVGGMAWVYTDPWSDRINDIIVDFQDPVTRENVVATLAEQIGSGPQLFNSLPGSDVAWIGPEYQRLTVTQEGDGEDAMLRARLVWSLRLSVSVSGPAPGDGWSESMPPDLVFRTCFEGSVVHCPRGTTLKPD